MRLIFFIALLPLTGCWTENTREQTRSVEIETQDGVVAGQPTKLRIKREHQETTEAKASSGIDAETYQAGLAALANTLTGNYTAALDKVVTAVAAKPAESGFGSAVEIGLGTLATALTGTTMHQVLGNRRKRKELSELRKDHIEVCKQLPPKRA